MGIIENIRLIKSTWDAGTSNIASNIRLLCKGLLANDLLPGEHCSNSLDAIAVTIYQAQQTPTDSTLALQQDLYKQGNPLLLTQPQLNFVVPPAANLGEASEIFSHLMNLKQPSSTKNASDPDTFAFVETLTASQRMRTQLVLNQSVLIDGRLHVRTPCCNGRPGGGYPGCALYQIDYEHFNTMTLGIYLSKAEYEIFQTTGQMPQGHDGRTCILCYSSFLTLASGLFGSRGVGVDIDGKATETMYYQDWVNREDGFDSHYVIVPGGGNMFPKAPFLAFHPRNLHIRTRGVELYVDESFMWYRPPIDPMAVDFRQGVVC